MNHYRARILASEFSKWLDSFKFDRFITLATNDPFPSLRGCRSLEMRLRDLLKEWDGRMNRKIVGPKWHDRPGQGFWGFFFLEKAAVNPHWHGLLRVRHHIPKSRAIMTAAFDDHAPSVWRKLAPKGTVISLPIYSQSGVDKYVTKSLGCSVSYDCFVVSGEFRAN